MMASAALKLLVWVLLVDIISASIMLSNTLSDNKQEDALFTGGYQHYDVGCYKLYTLPSTWGYAWKQCKEDGGHLVVIDSDEEYKVVRAMVKEGNQNVYIGAHDIFVEGWHFTVTGKRLLPSSYNIWSNGDPNEDNNRNCVVMNKNGELEDEDCADQFYFICEADLK